MVGRSDHGEESEVLERKKRVKQRQWPVCRVPSLGLRATLESLRPLRPVKLKSAVG